MGHRRTVLITGGARRVGRAIALRMAQGGFDILFTYHTGHQDADLLRQELNKIGVSAEGLQVDLEATDSIPRIGDWVSHVAPKLDILVNNAAIYMPDVTHDQERLMRRHMRINFEAPVLLTDLLADKLKDAGGHVINMIDILAERPMKGYAAYCASKAALLNTTILQARLLAPHVTVNGISPGVVEWAESMTLNDREDYLLRVPLRRAGQPSDVANLAYFLVTEGQYITGQNIRVDGGRSIGQSPGIANL